MANRRGRSLRATSSRPCPRRGSSPEIRAKDEISFRQADSVATAQLSFVVEAWSWSRSLSTRSFLDAQTGGSDPTRHGPAAECEDRAEEEGQPERGLLDERVREAGVPLACASVEVR